MAKADAINNSFYLGLVHYPVYDKHQQIVTTSITNIDIHDISRVCCSYGVRKYFIINPLKSQRDLYKKIIDFWQSDIGREYQPDRAEALNKIEFIGSYQEAIDYVKNQEKTNPIVITTTAKQRENQIEYETFHSVIFNYESKRHSENAAPVLLFFGTGYGLADELHEMADYVLSPIKSYSDYNHLSVRSAVAIVLDRLIPKNKGGINGPITSC